MSTPKDDLAYLTISEGDKLSRCVFRWQTPTNATMIEEQDALSLFQFLTNFKVSWDFENSGTALQLTYNRKKPLSRSFTDEELREVILPLFNDDKINNPGKLEKLNLDPPLQVADALRIVKNRYPNLFHPVVRFISRFAPYNSAVVNLFREIEAARPQLNPPLMSPGAETLLSFIFALVALLLFINVPLILPLAVVVGFVGIAGLVGLAHSTYRGIFEREIKISFMSDDKVKDIFSSVGVVAKPVEATAATLSASATSELPLNFKGPVDFAAPAKHSSTTAIASSPTQPAVLDEETSSNTKDLSA